MAECLLGSRVRLRIGSEILSLRLSFWIATNRYKLSDFCLPHTSLRQPLSQPLPTNGSGSAKQWRPCTPAMAAGLTEHVWTLREVLRYRVPPWPQPARV